jgi:hypothetical protein
MLISFLYKHWKISIGLLLVILADTKAAKKRPTAVSSVIGKSSTKTVYLINIAK